MGIVKQYHKDTDTTYVYESESYYDPKKKQSRSKRRVIGKIDKETGEIIPTGKRGPKVKNQAPEEKPDEKEVIKDLRSRITERDKKIDMLTKRIAIIEDENQKLRDESGEIKALRKENKRLLDIVAKIREITK